MPRKSPSTPSTAMPTIRNGSRRIQMSGYSTNASRASGQHTTSRMHQSRNLSMLVYTIWHGIGCRCRRGPGTFTDCASSVHTTVAPPSNAVNAICRSNTRAEPVVHRRAIARIEAPGQAAIDRHPPDRRLRAALRRHEQIVRQFDCRLHVVFILYPYWSYIGRSGAPSKSRFFGVIASGIACVQIR